MSIGLRPAWLFAVLVCAACGGSSEPIAAGGGGGTRPGDSGGCNGGATDSDAGADRNPAADPDAPPPGSDAAPPGVDTAPPDPGDCEPVVASHPIEGAQHMPLCAPLPYGTNPPSSGNHYAIWADYKTYTQPIFRGFGVHSLEHGAVVMTYNCPGGCADEVAAAQAFIDSLPADCGPMSRRLILTPDPELDVRFAASAWGYTLRANCFDRDAFLAFYNEHYDHAPESICGGGTDPTDLCGGSPCP